jgi:hypothetical protein
MRGTADQNNHPAGQYCTASIVRPFGPKCQRKQRKGLVLYVLLYMPAFKDGIGFYPSSRLRSSSSIFSSARPFKYTMDTFVLVRLPISRVSTQSCGTRIRRLISVRFMQRLSTNPSRGPRIFVSALGSEICPGFLCQRCRRQRLQPAPPQGGRCSHGSF